jgi:subtilisin family serine protease
MTTDYETLYDEHLISDDAIEKSIKPAENELTAFTVKELTEEEKETLLEYISIADDFAPDRVIVGLKANPSGVEEEFKEELLSDAPIVFAETEFSAEASSFDGYRDIAIAPNAEQTNKFIDVEIKGIKSLTEFDDEQRSVEYDGASELDIIDSDKIVTLTLDESGKQNVIDAISALNDNPFVAYATPDYYLEMAGVSTRRPSEFAPSAPPYIERIKMPYAWAYTTGDLSAKVKVAVIDSGFDMEHNDIATNVTPGGTGTLRRDFADDDFDPSPIPYSENGPYSIENYMHGTHVAGIIGAVWNGKMIGGIAPNVEIVPLKVDPDYTQSSGGILLSNAIEAINFSNSNGIDIINMSMGWSISNLESILGEAYHGLPLSALEDAIRNYSGLLVVCAMNNGVNIDSSASTYFPSTLSCENIISVASTNANDSLSSFSNYGAVSVDLAAPGELIMSPIPDLPSYSSIYGSGGHIIDSNGDHYIAMNGTSMAAPFVTGVAALIKAYNPGLSPLEIKKAILDSVDVLPSLEGKVLTGGRLNAQRALDVARTTHPRVAAGENFTAVINPDGTVSTWGFDIIDLASSSYTPQTIPGLYDIIAVESGYCYIIALRSDGTVWTVGYNPCGLGNGGYEVSEPEQVIFEDGTPLRNIIDISTFSMHSLAVDSAGNVYGWGDNDSGQLGYYDPVPFPPLFGYPLYVHNSASHFNYAVQIDGISDIVDVSAGERSSLAIDSNKQVFICGVNYAIQNSAYAYAPVAIDGLTDVLEISAGYSHGLALKEDGTLISFTSYNRSGGVLGTGTTDNDGGLQTVDISELETAGVEVRAISAGYDFSAILDSDGDVWTWGENDKSQLGHTLASTYIPQKVTGLSGMGTVAAGWDHAAALQQEGENLFADIDVYTWGSNEYYALGSQTPDPDGSDPSRITPLSAYTFKLRAPMMLSSSTWHWPTGSRTFLLNWYGAYGTELEYYDLEYAKTIFLSPGLTTYPPGLIFGSPEAVTVSRRGYFHHLAPLSIRCLISSSAEETSYIYFACVRTVKNGVVSDWSNSIIIT